MFQFVHQIKKSFLISDDMISELLHMFCKKFVFHPGDFENEISANGFEDSLITTKNRMLRIWNGEKCVFFWFTIVYPTTVVVVSYILKTNAMVRRIRKILESYEHERLKDAPEVRIQLPSWDFDSYKLWTVILFTTDGDLLLSVPKRLAESKVWL